MGFVGVIIAAVAVDTWLLDGSGARVSFPATITIGAIGIVFAVRPRVALVAAVAASTVSLFETAQASPDGARFAMFTEYVVLPVMFAAVLARQSTRRWPIVVLLIIAAEGVSLRAQESPIRSIVAISMFVLLGSATAAIVYIRLRDNERRASIEMARHTQRLEIARELHDIVGHHVTGIVVLAQASRYINGSAGESVADRALAEIEAAGRETLISVRRAIGLLRADPEAQSEASVADIERVIGDLRSTHPFTTLVIDNELRASGIPVDLAATVQRLIQESATNVRRHADATAPVRVTIHRSAETVELRVENRMLHPQTADGFGIVGMRERVDAVGGTFSAGVIENDQWVVHVALPIVEAATN